MSICDLSKAGLHDGQIKRITAIYETDTSHYAYLISQGCGKGGVLNVEDYEPFPDNSVGSFYAAIEQHCAERGNRYLCVVQADLDVELKVMQGNDGKFFVNLLKINKFNVHSTPAAFK